MGKIHAVEGDLLKIACELVRRRICSWVPLDNVFEVRGRKILNGLFGVAKTSTLDSGAPVLRLIMNLTGSNSTQRQLFGGCSTLPMITSWQSIVMDDGERLNMFQSDMSSAFYLFRLPLCWAPYLCFNVTVKGTEVGLMDNRLFALGCCVIPMGWINSVGIMQEISENLLKHQTLTLSSQVARGRPLPPWFTALLAEARSDNTCWWHIYLDNFCAGERLGASSATDWGRQCHEAAERCWREAGVISSEKKRVAGEITVQELGAEINGELGTLGISTAKLEKLCLTTLWALAQPRIERKTVQIIAGRWMFALQFRRPGMSLLQAVWKYVGGKEKATEKLLRQVRGELFSLVCCAPLFQCNLRAAVAPLVVASDASNSGGAVGVSETLTQEGKDFVSTTERIERGIPCQPAPILLVSLFNGIGGCFRAYDIAGLLPKGRIAVEINEDANRITARHWPGALQIKDIHTITRSVVREWSARFLQVAEIHVWAGFPCQDLCGAKAGRKNLMGKNSSLFWEIPRVVTLIKEEFGTTVVVKEVLENVQSMDKAAAEEISRAFGAWPYGLDCVDAVPLRRPRFCWTTEVIEGVIPGVVVESKSYWRQVQAQAEYPKTEQWIDPGFHWNGDGRDIVFPTCMRSIPRQAPPPKPAGLEKCSETTVQRWREDSFRYPPYQYQSQYLLCSDASWRLLNANEKELLLCYGWQHTKTAWSASRIKQNKVGYSDVRNSLLGDSFSIFSFVILAVVCSKRFLPTIPYVVLAGRMGLAPGFRAALRCSAPLARRLQYGFSTQDGSSISVEHLNRLLLRKTNHTGSDVRVITGEIMNAKTYPRQSVAAQWWHWREVFSKKWGHKQHINCLELESILMGVKYQILHHEFWIWGYFKSVIRMLRSVWLAKEDLAVGGFRKFSTRFLLTCWRLDCSWFFLTLNQRKIPLMLVQGGMVGRLIAGRFSKAERARQRSKIHLDDAALSLKTQQRYYCALRKLLPTIERCRCADDLDLKICNWIRRMWKSGEPLIYIGDGLCAMHFFMPWSKGKVPGAWKLFAVWRRLEVPSRAPPLTWDLVKSFSSYELSLGRHEMSSLLLLAFHCLLRTGELWQLYPEDILLGRSHGVLSLKGTKSGKRNAANESVSITNELVVESLRSLLSYRQQCGGPSRPLWSSSHAAFRSRFKVLCDRFDVQHHAFRPYSLRRGGATDLFQRTRSMECALLRGRWESSRVARIYISDGLSFLPSLRFTPKTQSMMSRFSYAWVHFTFLFLKLLKAVQLHLREGAWISWTFLSVLGVFFCGLESEPLPWSSYEPLP